MKKTFLISLLLFNLLKLYGQPTISGEYKENDESKNTAFKQILKLNCDKTFEYILISYKSFGRWFLKDTETLVLRADSMIDSKKTIYKSKEIKLHIRDNKIFLGNKIESKRKYLRRNKKINKQMQHPGIFEDYEKYKKRQTELHLYRVNQFKC